MRKITFSDFELDLDLFKLRRDGQDVEIGSRTLDLLVYLIENRGRVVENEELRSEVWESAALSRSSIPTCVRELRIALEDDASNPRFIETARGRGYRFVGEVLSISLAADPESKIAPKDLPFVGRAQEMEFLSDESTRVLVEARCSVVFVEGQAGIGKSRLLREFISLQGDAFQSYMITNAGVEGAPSFWPWIQLVREAIRRHSHENTDLSAQASILSTVFPEILEQPTVFAPQPATLDRFSLLSQWTRTIRSAAAQRPLLIGFEDIHASDFETLALLKLLTHELADDPILIVATMRPRSSPDAAAALIGEIAASPNSRGLDLGPLSATNIVGMLDPLVDDRESIGATIRYRSEGIAFYVTHLIKNMTLDSLEESQNALAAQLPPRPEDIVASQLSDLPAESRAALAVASVAGIAFSPDIVAAIQSEKIEDMVGLLEPAEHEWFILAEGPAYRFSHALLRDALYQSIPLSRRKAIHLRIGELLLEEPSPTIRTSEIAEHLLNAAPLGDTRVCIKISVDAGRQAIARYAYSVARHFLASALRIAESDISSTAPERCEIMIELSEAQLYDGDREGAYATLHVAASLARTSAAPKLLAECALRLAPDFLAIEIGSYDSRLVSLLREALSGIKQTEYSLRAQLLARLSHALLWSSDADQSEEIAIRAVRLARKSKNQTSLSMALAARSDSLWGPPRLSERIKYTNELQTIVRDRNRLSDSCMHHVRLIAALLERGDIPSLDTAIDSCERIVSEIGVPQYVWYPKTFKAMRSLMKGDLSETQRLAAESYHCGDHRGDENVAHALACQTACVLIESGRASLAIDEISRMSKKRPLVRSWAAGAGYIHLASNDLRSAISILNRFEDRDIRLLNNELGGSAGIVFLSEIASVSRDQNRQKTLYQLCCDATGTSATLGFAIAYFGGFSRYAGRLASALGAHSEAEEHFRTAIRWELGRNATLYYAHASLDLAAHIISTEGDITEARTLTERASQTRNIGDLTLLSQRAFLIKRRLDQQPTH